METKTEKTLEYNMNMVLEYNAPVTEEVVELPYHAEMLEMSTYVTTEKI